MRKLYFLLATAFILFGTAQFNQASGQCIIGVGATSSAGSTLDPVERYYNYEHFQMIYTAAELTAGGMVSGSQINAMGFSITESAASLANYTISMGMTAQTTFTSTAMIPAASLTVVKPAFTYAPVVQAAGSFDMITLTTPFVWDGVSSIVVNTCTGSNPFTSPYGGLRTNATANTVNYIRQDVTTDCATFTGTRTNTRPNIRFNFTNLPTCTVPSSIAASATANATSSTTISGSFTAAPPTVPSGYIVVRSTVNSLPTLTNGTTYTVGANGTVATNGYIEYVGTSAGAWTSTALTGGVTYYYFVFSYNNTACASGPKYSTTAQTASATTPIPPVITLNSFYVAGTSTAGTTSQCNATGRDISVDVSTSAGTINAVNITYFYNGVSQGAFPMNNPAGTTYTYTIPAASPVNATVTWSITATNTTGGTITYNGVSYSDAPLAGVTATATASVSSICSGSPFNLFGTNNAVVNLAEGFEGASFPPTGWSLINAGTGNPWTRTTSSAAPRTGTYAMTDYYNASNAENAWAFMPAQNLLAGTTYTLSFYYISGGFTEKFKVTVGSLATVAGQTTTLYTNNSATTNSYTLQTVTFTPVTTGTYYFAFNCFSAANQFYLGIDDVSLTGGPALNYTWTSSPAGFTSSSQNPTGVTATTTTTYYVTATQTSAPSCSVTSPGVTVIINPLPAAPTDATLPVQCGGPTFTATTASSTPTFNFYSDAAGTALVATNTTGIYSPLVFNSPGTNTVYVSVTSAGCTGPLTTISVVSSVAPGVSLSPTGTVNTCPGNITPITASSLLNYYTIYNWTPTTNLYQDAAATIPYTGQNLATVYYKRTTTTAGETITATGSESPALCSNTANVTFVVNPNPNIVAATALPNSICSGSPLTLTASSQTIATGFATIGTANTLTGATTQPSAFVNRWPSYRIQTIYTAAELTAAGLSAGNITSMAYNITTLGDAATNAAYNVKIGTTASSVFASTAWASTAGFTTVFPSATYTHTASGIQTIPFSTPFVWDGVSNIIIDITYSGANLTNNSLTYYTATPGFTVLHSDFNGSAAATGVQTTTRLNITFGGQVATTNTGSYNWTWNDGSGTVLSAAAGTVYPTNLTASPINITYTATATNAATGCSASLAALPVTVNPLPAAPVNATPGSQCGAPTFTATTAVGSPTFNFYSDPAGTVLVATNTTGIYSPITYTSPGTNTVYVSVTPSGGCASALTTISVVSSVAPAVTLSQTGSVATCSGTIQTLTASSPSNYYSIYNWAPTANLYQDPAATIPYTGQNLSTVYYKRVSLTAGETITATGSESPALCSNTASVTFVVSANPTAPTITASATAICSGAALTLTANTNNATYCNPPTYSSPGATGDYIGNVTFAGINNTTGDAATDYTYYTTPSATVTGGSSYPISVMAGGASSLYAQQFGVWIDYNQNGIFEASEFVFSTSTATFSPTAATGSIVIPGTAYNGTTRMRVISQYNTALTSGQGCAASLSFGETEDYNISISGATNNPSSGTITFQDETNTVVGSGSSITINPTATHTYTATVTNAGNCSATSTGVTVTIFAPLNGIYSVGSSNIAGEAGHFATLTAAVSAYNTICIGGPVTFALTDANYSVAETFPITINNNAAASSTNTLTIKPNTGVAATISGAAASTALIRIFNPYTTIDGSNNGSASQNLTITNISATSPNVLWIGSTGTTLLANVTVKNTNIVNGVVTTTAVLVMDGTTFGNNGYFSNFTFQNNNVQKASFGLAMLGATQAGNGAGTLVTGNTMTGSGANTIISTGISLAGIDGPSTISNNTISNLSNSGYTANVVGIALAGTTNNCTVSGNTISNLTYSVGSSNFAQGIYVTSTTGTSIVLNNNTISNITSNGTLAQTSGIYSSSPNSTITNNTISGISGTYATGATNFGIFVNNLSGTNVISGNTISNISNTGTAAVSGLCLQGTTAGVNVFNNKITNIKNTNAGGYGAYGMQLSSSSAAANTKVFNNFISDVAGVGVATLARNGHGLVVNGGAGYTIDYNTINMATSQTAAAGISTDMLVTAGVSAAAITSLQNNIFSNTETVGTNYGLYSLVANSYYTTIDYNDYYASSGNLGFLTSAQTTIAGMQAAFGQNANSVTIAPVFNSGTDLHLTPASNQTLNDLGSATSTTTSVDIDADVRPASGSVRTDMGADEFTPPIGLDMGVTALTAPPVKTCYTNAEQVTVTIKNYSINTIDFSVYPVTITVNVTGAVTQTLTTTISSGTLASNTTQSVPVGVLDMTTTGVYTFNANTSIGGGGVDVTPGNDAMTPAVTRTVVAVVAGTVTSSASTICVSGTPTLTLTGSAGGTIQWQESTSSTGPWNNVGTNSTTYTPASPITVTMYYQAVVSCATSATSNIVTVTVNNPQVLTTTPATRCGTGTVTLGATVSAGSTATWYAASSGGTALATGTSYTTPTINTNTNYYVDAENTGSPTTATFGAGAGTNTTTTYPAPYSQWYGGVKHQMIILASELTAQGLTAGAQITSVKFNVTSVGASFTGILNNFQIDMALTATSTASAASFIGGLTTVYGPIANQAIPTTALPQTVTHTLTTPITWDGSSNIVVQTSFSNNFSGNSPYAVLQTLTPTATVLTSYYEADNATSAAVLAATVPTATTLNRPNIIFGYTGICASPRTLVTASVTTPPVLTLSSNAISICNGSSSSPVTLTSSAASYDTYTWTPSTGVSGDQVAGWVFNPTTTTAYTLTASQSSGSLCNEQATLTVTVNQTPSAVTVTPTSANICSGSIQTLTASGGTISGPSTALLENFNGGAPGWSVTSTSSTSVVNWYQQSAPYTDVSGSATFSNFTTLDGGSFFYSNSDLGGSGSTTNTVLTSPTFSLVGYTAATLTFEQAFESWISDTKVALEVSTNGGGTWSTLQSYLGTNQGSTTNNAQTTTNISVNMSAYLGQANLKIRYNYVSSWGYYWIIDNVKVAGTASVATTTTWLPIAGLYSNAAATTPYVLNANTAVVYAKPTTTTTYTATATSPSNCTASGSSTVTVTPQPDATISYTGSPFCSSGTANVTMGGTYGTSGGTFSITGVPAAINSATGAINLALLTNAGSPYTITYTVAAAGGCSIYQPTTSIAVNPGGNWLGVDNNWFNAANWCGGSVPVATTNVIIPAGLSNYPIVGSGNAIANAVSIQTGASIIVNGTGIFSLHGALTTAGTGIINLSAGTLDLAGGSIGGSSISNSGAVQNLTLSGSVACSIIAGATNMVSVTGSVTYTSGNNSFNTNDNLTLVSTAAATAAFGDMTNNGAASGNTITGKVTVERYIGTTRKWQFLSIPTNTVQTVRQSWMEGGLAINNAAPGTSNVNNPKDGYGTFVTDNNAGAVAAGFDAQSLSGPSVKYPFPIGSGLYQGISNPSALINAQETYFNFVRGPRNSDGLPSNPGIYTPTTLRTTGPLKTGGFARTIAASPVMTPVGNPYAAAVDIEKLMSATTGGVLGSTIDVWDPKLTSGPNTVYGLGGFQYITRTGPGTFLVVPGGGSYPSGTATSIESGQAFFATASVNGTNLNFAEPQKTLSSANVNFTAGTAQLLQTSLLIRDASNNATLLDGVLLYTMNGFNNNIDYNDATKITNTGENVSIKSHNTLLAIEQRQPVQDVDTMFLNVTAYRAANYRWTFKLTNMDKPGRLGFMIDQYTGTEQALDLNGTNTYDFTVVNVAGSYAANRFYIVFRPAGVVPVTFTTISAARQADKTILVKWNTENELSLNHYETERSANGTAFSSIGSSNPTNNGGGSAAYSLTDVLPLIGDNYYRIKGVSNNGHVQYSAIVKVGPLTQDAQITVYPNPMSDRVMNVKFTNKPAGTYSLQLVNKAGQTLYSDKVTVSGINDVKTITFNKRFAAGSYQLIIRNETGEATVIQVVME